MKRIVTMDQSNRFKNTPIGIDRSGTRIILPSEPVPMTFKEAIEVLTLKAKEDETVVSVMETVEAFPLDGAYAFMNVLKEIYGWATPVPTIGFFGMEIPPKTVSLEIGFGKNTQVIWGQFKVPGIDGELATGVTMSNGRPVFMISGKVKQKCKNDVGKIAQRVREWVRENSVYRGHAIQLHTNDEGQFDAERPPRFLDLSLARPEELVFSDAVMSQIETNLFNPIEFTAECRKRSIPLKRGVLLAGKYGTGKTLTAFVTAKKCEDNGWTFIYIKSCLALKHALVFANMYAPAVVFAEDIDQVVTGGRTLQVNDILNQIDGVDSKSTEIITILTTNHVEKIEKAMLRPGRLDAVLEVFPPDAKAAEKLMRIYGRGEISSTEDLNEAGKELEGQIPATIREVVERSKLYAIRHSHSEESLRITGNDLANAARGMKNHLALLDERKDLTPSIEQQLGDAMNQVVQKAVEGNGLYKNVKETKEKVESIDKKLG